MLRNWSNEVIVCEENDRKELWCSDDSGFYLTISKGDDYELRYGYQASENLEQDNQAGFLTQFYDRCIKAGLEPTISNQEIHLTTQQELDYQRFINAIDACHPLTDELKKQIEEALQEKTTLRLR